MVTTKFYLDLRGRAKDGKGTILIILYHNCSSTSFSTGIRLHPDNWDARNKRVVKLAESDFLNASLIEQKGKIDKRIAGLSLSEPMFDSFPASKIKELIMENRKPKPVGHLVSDMFNDYIGSGELKENTKSIYNNTLKRIIAFSGKSILIEEIDLKWLRSFDKFLSKTQCANGKSIYLRALKAVCNYAEHLKVINQYPFDMFRIKQEPTRKRSVSVEDLRRFKDHPATPLQSMYRDYFFLMFYLIGINTKDLLLAKKNQVIDGRLEYVRAKTGKKYSVKIEPEAERLIQAHSGKGDYLLDVMDHCKLYRSFQHQINDAIKLIGDKVKDTVLEEGNLFAEEKEVIRIEPVIPKISTNSARHCWATFAYEIGISTDVISQALGHSFGHRTTFIYIKPDQGKVDTANRKVIDYLLG